ncbi:hypothetical protein GEMRC1_012922 [Eukaryota sp. GEM-RC1]
MAFFKLSLFLLFLIFVSAKDNRPFAPPSNRHFPIYSALGFAEPVNSWSHLLTAALTLAFCPVLFKRCKDKQAIMGVSLFIFGSVFSMSISGVYHLLPTYTMGRLVLRRIDHAAIFCFISGTFSAIHSVAFFDLLVTLANRHHNVGDHCHCSDSKDNLFDQFGDSILSGALYIAMGWMGTISMVLIWREHKKFRPLFYLIVGGLMYTIGAIQEGYLQDRLVIIDGVIHSHEVFHFFIMAGLYYHFKMVFYSLVHFHTNYHQKKQSALIKSAHLTGITEMDNFV